jgi:hypothetical protein
MNDASHISSTHEGEREREREIQIQMIENCMSETVQ